jgi:hydrogenase maturation protease
MGDAGTILVLGLGNTLLSDDGVGVHVVEALRAEFEGRGDSAFSGVSLRDGGTLGLALLPDVEAAAGLIVVDASEIGCDAGDVRLFEGSDMDRQLFGKKRTAHEVAAADLLDAAALTGHRPERRALVAVQPASTEWGLRPTAAVESSIPAACAAVRSLLARWQS